MWRLTFASLLALAGGTAAQGQDTDSSQACGDEEQYVMFLIDASATTCVQNSNPDRSGWNCDDLQLALQYASQVRTKARPQPRGC